ncbi:hypothetical protein ACFP3T_12350 [Lactiplantibacillus dongliensis]|uniref:Uncharacterized protein n=1 Tax=Lactiplantibacillus dongliensis TaxID=2559919 RepID=A0ABW1R6C5_9LACO|nr:hypothetical protein [Lactiplantibacillus dongliensis]
MPKKNNRQKKGLAKRLWHSITEPIPDENDDQANEQIPLAYDLKDPDSSSSQAASADSQPTSEVSEQPVINMDSEATEAPLPTRRSRLAAQSTAAEDLDETPHSVAASQAAQPTSEATSTVASATSAPSSASWRQMPTMDTTTSAATGNGQPVISINASEAASADDEPQIPLSREELFEDQQPNAGSAANTEDASAEPMSRMARHNETDESATTDTGATNENPHLKKKQKPAKPHQKPKSHRSGKLVAAGVGILIVAALGFMFMWTHAKTTQAQAKANAEEIVKEIYTTDAQRDLRSGASSDKLAQLQTYIDELSKSDEKASLQSQHDTAAKMLKLRSRVEGLYTGKLIKAAVTTKTVKAAQATIKDSGLTSKKAYFTKKLTTQLVATGKTVKKVQSDHKDFKALYTKKDKLKSTVSTLEVDGVLKQLKKYRTKSQLAADDYTTLKADRKALAKSESSAAAASASAYSDSVASSSMSESAASSSAADESSSSDDSTYSSSDDTSSTGTTGTGNDTTTSSAKHSSSTTTSTDNSQTTGTGTGNGTSDNTTTGNDTTGTTGDTTTTTTN